MQNIILQKYFKSFEYGVFTEGKGVRIVKPHYGIEQFLIKMNRQNKHIFIRPNTAQEPFYLLIDDLNEQQVIEDHKLDDLWVPGRMVVETSPGNYQIWLHNERPLNDIVKRHWLDRFQSDLKATPNKRWGRCPGYWNVKKKYRRSNGSYPEAKLIWWDDQTQEQLPEINSKTLLQGILKRNLDGRIRKPLGNDICREMYNRGYDYRTDFAYVLALLKRNFTEVEIENRILNERTDWDDLQHRKTDYIQKTIVKAQQVLSRRRPPLNR